MCNNKTVSVTRNAVGNEMKQQQYSREEDSKTIKKCNENVPIAGRQLIFVIDSNFEQIDFGNSQMNNSQRKKRNKNNNEVK